MPHPRSTSSTRPVADTTEPQPFGLLAWLEESRVRLPLKGVEARFDIRGDLVGVEIDQIWHQDNAQPVHCLYTFPLPAGAAVYRCELHVNDRVLIAKVEELGEARRIAAEKKAAGHRTALVEQVRDNVFELALGNLAPGDVAVIRLAYVHALERNGRDASFRLPMCPGVRYIAGNPLLRNNQGRGAADDTDQVPDASRMTPPRIDALHPDAAYVSIHGTIADPHEVIANLVSPSHALLARDEAGSQCVSLAQHDAVPDRDFVMRWTEGSAETLQSSAWTDGSGRYLVRIVAPEAVATTDRPQDVYFLLDRSGSMQGVTWAKACAALRVFPTHLGADDRLWVTLFDSAYRDFAEKPLPTTELARMRAWTDLEQAGTAGGTELLPALQHVLGAAGRHSTGRPASLVVITDGQVGNETEIEHALSAHRDLRLHVFLIGAAANDDFARRLARQQRGTFVALTPADDIPAMVSRLAIRLRQPVVTDLVLDDGWEPAAEGLPDLHAGETLSVTIRGPSNEAGIQPLPNFVPHVTKFGEHEPVDGREIRLRGRDGAGAAWTVTLAVQQPPVPAVRILWARERIGFLEGRSRRDEAVALAREHNLLCQGTAFVAWDSAEKVIADSALDLYQPALADSPENSPVGVSCMFSLEGLFEETDTVAMRTLECRPPPDWLGASSAHKALRGVEDKGVRAPRRSRWAVNFRHLLRKSLDIAPGAGAELVRQRSSPAIAELESLVDRCRGELDRLEAALLAGGKPYRQGAPVDLLRVVRAMRDELSRWEGAILQLVVRLILTYRRPPGLRLDAVAEELRQANETLRELVTLLEACQDQHPRPSAGLPAWAGRLLQVPDRFQERLRRDRPAAAALDRLQIWAAIAPKAPAAR